MKYNSKEAYTDFRRVKLTSPAKEYASMLQRQFSDYILELGIGWVENEVVPRLMAGFFEKSELGENQKSMLSPESLLFGLSLELDEHEVVTIDVEGDRFFLLGIDMANLYPDRP